MSAKNSKPPPKKRLMDLETQMRTLQKNWGSLSKDFLKKLEGLIPGAQSALETVEDLKNHREEYQESFQGFDQRVNQLFNILSTVLKAMKEAQAGISRNTG